MFINVRHFVRHLKDKKKDYLLMKLILLFRRNQPQLNSHLNYVSMAYKSIPIIELNVFTAQREQVIL